MVKGILRSAQGVVQPSIGCPCWLVIFISVKFLERNDDIVVMHEDVLVLKRYMPMYLGMIPAS